MNIRDILGPAIGLSIVDITEHDKEDFDPKRPSKTSYIALLLSDGSLIKFFSPCKALEIDGPLAETIGKEAQ